MLHVTLRTLSSGFFIDLLEFRDNCMKTAKMYVNFYDWNHMAQSKRES